MEKVTIYIQENYLNDSKAILNDLRRFNLNYQIINLLEKRTQYHPNEIIIDRRGIVFPLLWQKGLSGILFPPQTLTRKNLLSAFYLIQGDFENSLETLKTNDALASYILNEPRINDGGTMVELKGEDHYYKIHSSAVLQVKFNKMNDLPSIIKRFNRACKKSPSFEYQNFSQMHLALSLIKFDRKQEGIDILKELKENCAHEAAYDLINSHIQKIVNT